MAISPGFLQDHIIWQRQYCCRWHLGNRLRHHTAKGHTPDYPTYTSVVNDRTPLALSCGVFILISQSTTKTVPAFDFMTFSSCMSLRYISGIAYVQFLGLMRSNPIFAIKVWISPSDIRPPSMKGCSTMILKLLRASRPKPMTSKRVSGK